MLDDFRQQAEESFLEEETPPPSSPSFSIPTKIRLFGMSPAQTFIVAVLLLVASCLLSAFCLLVTGRVVPPFVY
jgi:hypothetical protein